MSCSLGHDDETILVLLLLLDLATSGSTTIHSRLVGEYVAMDRVISHSSTVVMEDDFEYDTGVDDHVDDCLEDPSSTRLLLISTLFEQWT